MSLPSSRIFPEIRAPSTNSCMRLRLRRRVDFPHPEGPMIAVTLFSGKLRETSLSTWLEPNQACTEETAILVEGNLWDANAAVMGLSASLVLKSIAEIDGHTVEQQHGRHEHRDACSCVDQKCFLGSAHPI